MAARRETKQTADVLQLFDEPNEHQEALKRLRRKELAARRAAGAPDWCANEFKSYINLIEVVETTAANVLGNCLNNPPTTKAGIRTILLHMQNMQERDRAAPFGKFVEILLRSPLLAD